MRPWFLFLYVLITGVTIVGAIQPELTALHSYAKPLLMLSLMLCVLFNWRSTGKNLLVLLLFALLFSLFGDVLLLPELGEKFFIFGLVSFLLAHILYIILFLKIPSRPMELPFIRRNPWTIFVMILYGGWMYLKVKDGADEIAWAVLIYILVIMTMAIIALNRQGTVSKMSFQFVTIGAVLFLVSDSLLAWNKFVEPIDHSPIYILSTYALAQLAIVRGVLVQVRETSA